MLALEELALVVVLTIDGGVAVAVELSAVVGLVKLYDNVDVKLVAVLVDIDGGLVLLLVVLSNWVVMLAVDAGVVLAALTFVANGPVWF